MIKFLDLKGIKDEENNLLKIKSDHYNFYGVDVYVNDFTQNTKERYFGRELEFYCSNYSVNGARRHLEENFVYYDLIVNSVVSDASIRGGFEIVLNPYTMEFFDKYEHIYKELWQLLKEMGVRVRQNCGGHIHISANTMTNYKIVMIEKWMLENKDALMSKYKWLKGRFGVRFVSDGQGIKFKNRKRASSNFLNSKYHTIAYRAHTNTYEIRVFKTPKDFKQVKEQNKFLKDILSASIHNRNITTNDNEFTRIHDVQSLYEGQKVRVRMHYRMRVSFWENSRRTTIDRNTMLKFVGFDEQNGWVIVERISDGKKCYLTRWNVTSYFAKEGERVEKKSQKAKICNGIVLL